MITFSDIYDYFTQFVPNALGLKFPEACGAIVGNILMRELKDPNFLPAEKMTSRERAEFAIVDIGGYQETPGLSRITNEMAFKAKCEKYKLIAEALIINHQKISHPERIAPEDEFRLKEIRRDLKAYGLSELEQKMVDPITNGWTFAPAASPELVENEKRPAAAV